MKFTNVLFEKDQIPNIKAIMHGHQIILCKKTKATYADSDIVFLVSSKNTGQTDINQVKQEASNFLLSHKGEEILKKYGREKVGDTDVIVKCRDIKLKLEGSNNMDKLRNLFTDLFNSELFSLWDIEYGPLKYFAKINECYIRFYRAYKVPFELKEAAYRLEKTYEPPILRDKFRNGLLEKINSTDMYSTPVLPECDFKEIEKRILRLISKHGLSDDPEVVEAYSKRDHTLQEDNISEILYKKKQIILYGPPGTGKTYRTKRIAVDACR